MTLTGKEHWSDSSQLSVQLQVTVAPPTWKKLPETGLQIDGKVPSSASIHTGAL